MARIDVDKILRTFLTQNREPTDPGVFPLPQGKQNRDAFIPPEEFSEPSAPKLAPAIWNPLGWFQNHIHKKRDLSEAKERIAKIDLIPDAAEEMIRHFFDRDLQRLAALSQRHPAEIHRILQESLERSCNRKHSEPWYRLVQVACGDFRAILPALDSLC